MQHPKLTGLIIIGAILFAFVGTTRADTVPGCAANETRDYSAGFNPGGLLLLNTDIYEDGYIVLRTGHEAIDPDNIVIPVDQEVSVTFLYEGAGFQLTDFGWMYAEDGKDGPKTEVYQNINDNPNGGDGVLDTSPEDTTPRYGDANADGSIDALDNRQVLGTFSGGTELVFYLKVDNQDQTYFTK